MGLGIIIDAEKGRVGQVDCSWLFTCDVCGTEVCPGCEQYALRITRKGGVICPECQHPAHRLRVVKNNFEEDDDPEHNLTQNGGPHDPNLNEPHPRPVG